MTGCLTLAFLAFWFIIGVMVMLSGTLLAIPLSIVIFAAVGLLFYFLFLNTGGDDPFSS